MTRVITALLMVPLFLGVIIWGPHWAVVVLCVIVGCLCFHEFAGIADHHSLVLFRPFGFAFGVVGLLLPSSDPSFVLIALLLAMAASLRSGELSAVLPRSGAMVAGVLYCFWPWRSALWLHQKNPLLLVFALSVNWVGDTAAYYSGRFFGKRKMAPRVSPNKTWEGAVGSLAGSLLFGLVFLPHASSSGQAVEFTGLSVAANLAGQIGDLVESALKRGAGLKDSGSGLPGHGGWLDRVDASLFALPVVHAWVAWRSW